MSSDLLLAEGPRRRRRARDARPRTARRPTRLETYTPDRPLPKLFRLTDKGKLNESLFAGSTINTPSMLCVEDYIDTLTWAKSIGGLDALRARSDARASPSSTNGSRKPRGSSFSPSIPATRSNTSVCFSVVDPVLLGTDAGAAFVKELIDALGDGRCRPRHRRLSRCADRPADLVRPDGRHVRHRHPHAMARLGRGDAARVASKRRRGLSSVHEDSGPNLGPAPTP